jgi:hypothetical protein
LIVFLFAVQSEGSIFLPTDNPWQKPFTSAPQWESKSEQTSFNNSQLFKVHITMPHHFQTVEEALSGIQMSPRPMKALVLGCINGAQKEGIASD